MIKEEEEETTPPNSPRRRRITTNGASKMIKLHSSSLSSQQQQQQQQQQQHIHDDQGSGSSVTGNGNVIAGGSNKSIPSSVPSLNYLATIQSKTIATTTPSNSVLKNDEMKEKDAQSNDNKNNNEMLTWSTMKESNKTAKIEKFLWEANISDDISKTDNNLLKEVLVDCTMKYLKSRPIQMRAYQLLQDLTLGTMVQPFYTEDEIQQRFFTTIESLKQWKSNEYVTAAAFEYLAALYFKNVKHDYSESNKELLELVGEAFQNLKKSKTVMRSLVAFLSQLYLYLEESTIASSPSLNLVPSILSLIQENLEEKTITYQCCSILAVMSTKCPSAIQIYSESIVNDTLHVLSYHHKNIDIYGTIFSILSACAFEEKHVNYLLTQQLKEFQFMCQSISMFQDRGDIDVIESVLIVIKRCVHSDCMLELNQSVRNDIQDAIRTTMTHRPDCTDHEACLASKSCNITENHISLCMSIINALSALQVGLNSNDQRDTIEELSEPEDEPEVKNIPNEPIVIERVKSPAIQAVRDSPLNDPGSMTPKRRGSETQPNDNIAYLKRKEEHQAQVIKLLQQEIEDWKNKYEELRKLSEELMAMRNTNTQEASPLEESSLEKGIRNESVTFHTTVQNKSETTPETTAPWSPIHMEEEYQEFHDLDHRHKHQNNPSRSGDGNGGDDGGGGGDVDPNHLSHPIHDEIGSFSTFDVNDIDSNVNYFPEIQVTSASAAPPSAFPLTNQYSQTTTTELELILKDISMDDRNSIALGMREALEFISQSQTKFIQKLQASLAVLQISTNENTNIHKMKNKINLFEMYPLDESVENEIIFVLFYLFKFLHQQLCASSKKAGLGRDGYFCNTIPRSIVRRVLKEFLSSFPVKKAALLSDVDIILQPLPIQLNLQEFTFSLTVATCRRVGVRGRLNEGKLMILFSKFLEILNEYCNRKDIFGVNINTSPPAQSPTNLTRSLGVMSGGRGDGGGSGGGGGGAKGEARGEICIQTLDEEIKACGLRLLEKDDQSLFGIFALYSHNSSHLHLDSILTFARDFNICPQLIVTGDLIYIYERILVTDQPQHSQQQHHQYQPHHQQSMDYYKFKLFLIEIAMICQCFGEETKESTVELGKQRVLIAHVSSLLWYMEHSSGYEKMISRDRSRPVTIPFKVNHQVLILNVPGKRLNRTIPNSSSGTQQIRQRRQVQMNSKK